MSDFRNKLLAVLKKRSNNSRVRLPDQKCVSFAEYDPKAITINLKVSAVTDNMQKDVAAFEAWALALHHGLDDRNVLLEWDTPDDTFAPEHSATKGHYNRFLFRVKNFTRWFNWFKVSSEANQKEIDPWDLSNHAPLFLNRQSALRPDGKRPSDEATEHDFECYFTSKEGRMEIDKALGCQEGFVLERQIPVGLFKDDPPTQDNALFSRGKSAIDLCAVDGTVAHVIELKSFEAQPKMGVLSEALLYAAIVRGVQKSQIRFAHGGSHSGDRPEIAQLLPQTTSVQAHILAPSFHPLLNHDDVLKILNRGLATDGIGLGYLELKRDCRIEHKYTWKP